MIREKHKLPRPNFSEDLEDRNCITAEFHYSIRGGLVETNHTYMMRSVVYQLWKQNSNLFPLLRPQYRGLKQRSSSKMEQGISWSHGDLKAALALLHKIEFHLEVFIVIDGLDESDDAGLSDMLQLLASLSNETSSCIIKILISSRPETTIRHQLAHGRHIILQDFNHVDISREVDKVINELDGNRTIHKKMAESTTPQQRRSLKDFANIREYILKSSQGVFLWVHLVLKEMSQIVTGRIYRLSDLESRIKRLPRDLGGPDGYFRLIVESLIKRQVQTDVDEEERADIMVNSLRILNWVTFSRHPVSIRDLEDIMATPPLSDLSVVSENHFNQDRIRGLEDAMSLYCGGLVEVGIWGSDVSFTSGLTRTRAGPVIWQGCPAHTSDC
ncbi:hypothetical protein K461DRAFT_2148 [Myriangium duriaei CBS 260.36]|uniref:Nephrocystin 3-like N-terminal domain-containing protein n=1 Tax=Myriangium duriaei CBS 260.36 TaxID=1168546 RepID=A0A9P4MKU0_9PEZI|nr:hypothetical protein K461DRAFT_2148 [Myriangium duriaei CBS 260.36]